jgi:hypothetical protein
LPGFAIPLFSETTLFESTPKLLAGFASDSGIALQFQDLYRKQLLIVFEPAQSYGLGQSMVMMS